MGELYFPLHDIEPLLTEAQTATRRIPCEADFWNEALLRPGERPLAPELGADLAQIDDALVSPTLLLVRDVSIYIMSNASFEEAGVGHCRRVVYAHGLDPRDNRNWSRDARELLGDDDFARVLDAERVATMMGDCRERWLKVTLTGERTVLELADRPN